MAAANPPRRRRLPAWALTAADTAGKAATKSFSKFIVIVTWAGLLEAGPPRPGPRARPGPWPAWVRVPALTRPDLTQTLIRILGGKQSRGQAVG